jgi:hypothetical protein
MSDKELAELLDELDIDLGDDDKSYEGFERYGVNPPDNAYPFPWG